MDLAPKPQVSLGVSGRDQTGQRLLAEIENLLELRANHQAIQDCAKRTKRRNVMDEIAHLGFLRINRAKEMFVMPDAVGPDALFIDKVMRLLDPRDFRQPRDRDPKQRRDGVADHQPRINFRGQFRFHLEAERGRRDPGEVARIGEKTPAPVE